ncbi:hypothetical protein [Streptomyces gossypiisoli]|uniref:hypothetical protein n=1 Tax=Streptomyces gossypiisoli TaxID=2748864 RepID=UPI0015D9AA05|nr:hypothetical protein [Streptomyces gossypiisoli]
MRSSYSRGEKLRLAVLVAKAAKQSMAGDRNEDTISPRVKREVERIEERAAARGQAEAEALAKRLTQARTAAAAAKAQMRASTGKERAAARQQMNEHERAARRLEGELRRYL